MKMQRGADETGSLTIEEFARLPDEPWHMELVRGHVVREPLGGFEHGTIVAHFGSVLLDFVTEHRLGAVVGNCGFILIDEPPTVRAPDTAFIRGERLDSFDPRGYVPFAPDLAVEVVGPTDKMSQTQAKVIDYLDAGTRLVWVVDPKSRSVEVYRSRDEIRLVAEDGVIDGGDALPGFRLKVSELFSS
jgi:Uma2 family endonuclease